MCISCGWRWKCHRMPCCSAPLQTSPLAPPFRVPEIDRGGGFHAVGIRHRHKSRSFPKDSVFKAFPVHHWARPSNLHSNKPCRGLWGSSSLRSMDYKNFPAHLPSFRTLLLPLTSLISPSSAQGSSLHLKSSSASHNPMSPSAGRFSIGKTHFSWGPRVNPFYFIFNSKVL